METNFGALCTDFYVNQKLAMKMDLPEDRETILHFFDRIRKEIPSMDRFRRYSGELSLESGREEGEYRWMGLHRQTVRSGHVNPAQITDAYQLHKLVLYLAPYHLTISPLDVDYLELLFGFDLECKTNHNEVVFEALVENTPMAGLMDYPGAKLLDVQPVMGMSLSDAGDLEAFFEIKTRTTNAQIKANRFRAEPISIYCTIRKYGPIKQAEDLPLTFEVLRQHGEQLVQDKVVPDLLAPISRAISHTA